ncbi:MAG TPA: Rieske 2Fe-2S domain-containing protein [Pirellulaceae bacterium]|nr:Rieske 2Fe-2S domain-containing protein [Pirellulaceae bacterium]HMO92653.1 Rieske 2Fe-2S domain-containing protein [Pirellulaceae bacterium]HMP70199.1 Rieske 2Fe-2S domain-containing protein [Pirellulaceae bacterium]
MHEYQPVCKTTEIPEGEGRSFHVDRYVVAIFNVAGTFYAIDDRCPHMGVSLSTGHLEDCVVTCPLHAWRFDVRDGTWMESPRVKTTCFSVRVVGDQIEVAVPKKT